MAPAIRHKAKEPPPVAQTAVGWPPDTANEDLTGHKAKFHDSKNNICHSIRTLETQGIAAATVKPQPEPRNRAARGSTEGNDGWLRQPRRGAATTGAPHLDAPQPASANTPWQHIVNQRHAEDFGSYLDINNGLAPASHHFTPETVKRSATDNKPSGFAVCAYVIK